MRYMKAIKTLSLLSLYRLFGKLIGWTLYNSLLVSTVVEFLYFTLFCTNFTLLIYVFRQKLLISVNNRFEIVDEVLNKCADYEIDKDYTNDLIFAVNLFTSICLIITMDLFYSPSLSVFFENLPAVISGAVIIQYTMLLNRIDKRFKSINSTISKLVTLRSNDTQTHISSVTLKVLSRESVINDVDNLKFAFMELRDMCQDTADFYGIPILIAIFCFAVRTISTVYFIILSFFNVPTINMVWHVDGIRLIWATLLFTTLTTSATRLMKQNKKLGKTINLLTDQHSMDEKIITKLSKFSSDLWHLKIELTACDIIPLDRTLLAIITGTLATYLVIGVQFALNTQSD